MPPTQAEYDLDSKAIGIAAAVRDNDSRIQGDTLARIRHAAKEDAAELLRRANGSSLEEAAIAATIIVQHLTVEGLAQMVNYHACVHAGLVRDDNQQVFANCPVCDTDLR